MTESRPPFPPFTHETAQQKVQAAEDAWNTRDPERVAWPIPPDSHWRNPRPARRRTRADRGVSDAEVSSATSTTYCLKSLWDFHDNRIAVRFQYECHDATDSGTAATAIELWEFTPEGLMARREASINDVKIDESERRYFGPRPAGGAPPRHSAVVTA